LIQEFSAWFHPSILKTHSLLECDWQRSVSSATFEELVLVVVGSSADTTSILEKEGSRSSLLEVQVWCIASGSSCCANSSSWLSAFRCRSVLALLVPLPLFVDWVRPAFCLLHYRASMHPYYRHTHTRIIIHCMLSTCLLTFCFGTRHIIYLASFLGSHIQLSIRYLLIRQTTWHSTPYLHPSYT